jgi:uncharacterized membrane protein YoaK (UPF0700 family)
VRTIERDGLLFILAVSAGSADGWSYFGLGHAFVANMTGNTVLLGMAVFQNHGDMLHPLLSLACYAAGVVTASLLTGRANDAAATAGREVIWSRAVSWTLLLEGVLIGAAEAGWIMMRRGWGLGAADRDVLSLNLLLGVVAAGIGMQSGAILVLKVPGVTTTYITGTWTTLLNGLVRFTTQKRQQDAEERIQLSRRLGMQAGVLTVYFGSAVLTGWLFRYTPLAVGALPAGTVLLVAAYGMVRTRSG